MRRHFRRVVRNDDSVNVNVVPMIDIIFSVLMAFMVPSQSLFGGLNVELPTAKAKIVVLKKDPIKIFINRNGNIIIDKLEVRSGDLVSKVNELSLKDKNIKIYVMADKRNSYGAVLDVVSRLNTDNFKDVVLISDIHGRL
ncbi:MAG: biopolymer transporter ExbD [Rickettsiales bacterium]|jgi:biopolymer transport protein ExbD|nr:biopolymer transporter ExbD [Rickettsiales bacterium]